jgi:hypothetical protein
MTAYMDTPHYRVNKFVSTMRVLGSVKSGVKDVIYVAAGDILLSLDDLEAVVREASELRAYAVALKDAAQGVADLCGPPLDKDEREFVMHLDRLHSLLKVDCGHEIDSHASTEGKTS